MKCSWNCFPTNNYDDAKENTLSLQCRSTQRLSNCISWILFTCNYRQMWCLWKENTLGGFCFNFCVWTLKCLFVQILCGITELYSVLCWDCFWVLAWKANINPMKAKRMRTISCCVCHHQLYEAGLTVKATVPGIFCHTAAHWLVPLSDVTRSPIQAVVVANPPLTERPRETDRTAACRFT